MKDYLGYILVKLLSAIFCILPLRLGLFIGRCIGTIAFLINKKRKMIAYANLKAAFCKEKSPQELKKLTKGVYQNFGRLLIEVLRFPVMNRAYIKKYISINGLENVKEARAQNKGTIILTGHFGNWELLSLIGGFLGYPVSVLAREQKHTRLNELLNSYRQMAGCKVIKKGLSTRQLIRALVSNELVGILTDQDAGKLGTFVSFFGRPASTHSGAFIFAQKTGAKILPAFIVRVKGPYHRIEVLRPIETNKGPDEKKDIFTGVQRFSNILEDYVRKYPTQWLWVHKRWKSTPQRSILILTDGRAGHLNQSIAVADIIKRYRQDKGFASDNTTYEIVDVKYKNNFLRAFLAICSNFASSRCQGCMRCMKYCLEKESYEKLMGTYADIVISCGSSLAPVNVFLAKENNGKNIIIMKPNLVSLKRFKLAIVPQHDKPANRKNVLVTAGSPNRISEEMLRKEAQRFSPMVNLSKPLILGLLLGGDNQDYEMDTELIKALIGQIKSAAERFDLEILVTTSRRTPQDVALQLKKELTGFSRCKLFIDANEKNIEGAVPAILGLSKIILVSGESASMVSEAATAGKYTLVFPLKKKNAARTRHDILVEELDRSGFIKFTALDEVEKNIAWAINSREAPKKLNDYDKIYNAVGTVL